MSTSTTLDCVAQATFTWLKRKKMHPPLKLKILKTRLGSQKPLGEAKTVAPIQSRRSNVGLWHSTRLKSTSSVRCTSTVVMDRANSTRRWTAAAAFSSGNQVVPDADGSSLCGDDMEFKNTLALVESAMFAAAAGLVYFLSNLFRLEAYFGCFFPLSIVISSLRWGVLAGGKTMIATTLLLFVLSGPIKAVSYLLMHGLVGVAMGALWRWGLNWGLSLAACTLVRSIGVMGFISLSSWVLRENILTLITINAHASFSYILAALGANVVPKMQMIYAIFATLVLVNCGSFIFLLHVLYAIFFRRMGIKIPILLPPWIERALDGNG